MFFFFFLGGGRKRQFIVIDSHKRHLKTLLECFSALNKTGIVTMRSSAGVILSTKQLKLWKPSIYWGMDPSRKSSLANKRRIFFRIPRKVGLFVSLNWTPLVYLPTTLRKLSIEDLLYSSPFLFLASALKRWRAWFNSTAVLTFTE